jgi:tetratricopeptide (TPR) repeat protein
LLEEAAARSPQPDVASHWLTEAALVQLAALRDPGQAQATLAKALELDPMNDRAAEALSGIYRTKQDDKTLAAHLTARAKALESLCDADATLAAHAADAYEALGIHYSEQMGAHEQAVVALRKALSLHRGRSSSHEPLAADAKPHETAAPPRSRLRTKERESDLVPQPQGQRDTLPTESEDSAPSSARSETPTQVDTLAPGSTSQALGSETDDEPEANDGDRRSGDRLIGLFEALHAVRCCTDAMEAAALVVQIARDALDAEAGLVHLYDIAAREYVVSAALGAHHQAVVGTRTPESDPLLERAQHETAAVTANRLGNGRMLAGERWRIVGAKRSVVCAPAQFDGVIYGAVELVDPKGRATFDVRDQDALTYVGERIAEFLAEHVPLLG